MINKYFTGLVSLIAFLAACSCVIGLWTSFISDPTPILSYLGEEVMLYGNGLYQNDSISVASQGLAQDVVTLFVAIPLLLYSLYKARNHSIKGVLLLLGTLGYFLYTYISYVFLWMLNPLFIVYVSLMSGSFFAFVWLFSKIDLQQLVASFQPSLPRKPLGFIQLLLGAMLFFLWVSMIAQYMINGQIPTGLDHYTTLVIQGLDLGFIVPISILSGVLLIKDQPLGYLLSSVVIIKGFTMGLAILAMLVGQSLVSSPVSPIEYAMFTFLSVILMISLFVLLINIDETKPLWIMKD